MVAYLLHKDVLGVGGAHSILAVYSPGKLVLADPHELSGREQKTFADEKAELFNAVMVLLLFVSY